MYTYFSVLSSLPTSTPSLALSFSRCLAFKVKTFQPNYKTNPFERRCFDVYALYFLILFFLSPWHDIFSLQLSHSKPPVQSKTSQLKPHCLSEKEKFVGNVFFCSVRFCLVLWIVFTQYFHHTLHRNWRKKSIFCLVECVYVYEIRTHCCIPLCRSDFIESIFTEMQNMTCK